MVAVELGQDDQIRRNRGSIDRLSIPTGMKLNMANKLKLIYIRF